MVPAPVNYQTVQEGVVQCAHWLNIIKILTIVGEVRGGIIVHVELEEVGFM